MRKKMLIILFSLLMLTAHIPALWACSCCKHLQNVSTGDDFILVDAYDHSYGWGFSYLGEVTEGVSRHYCVYSNGSKWNCEIIGGC
jgi:hypothetical protein